VLVPANRTPTALNLSNIYVAENSPSGTTVGTFTTTDPTAGQTHTYSLVAGPFSDDNAKFSIVGNTLKTAVVFDFEKGYRYHIRVRTTNSLGLWVEKVFEIYVTDLNEAPTIAVAPGGTCGTNGGTMNLTVRDHDNFGSYFTVTAGSSNTTLVPTHYITFGGSGENLTVTINGRSTSSGSATITITVTDSLGLTTTRTIKFIKGTTSGQTLTGGTGSNLIVGMGGVDTLTGGGSNDLLCGGSSTDTINGGGGLDTINGGGGNDRLSGGDGNDTLTGGLGRDFFSGGAGTDRATDFRLTEGDTKDSTLEQY
jgi:Ca2+-binding RTX toxin-like protein